jgi:dTDP-4-amino-4,6-dideoxygalactose transaminase
VEGVSQRAASRLGNQGINLPSGVRLRREEADYICESIRQILDAT